MADETWRDRLRDAIKAADKTDSQVSLEAGLSRGYVNGILVGGKEPTLERLMAVCEAVPVSFIHVVLGVDAAPDDVRILKALQDNPETRAAILALLSVKAA